MRGRSRWAGKVSRGHKGYEFVSLSSKNNEHREFSISDETTSWFKNVKIQISSNSFLKNVLLHHQYTAVK